MIDKLEIILQIITGMGGILAVIGSTRQITCLSLVGGIVGILGSASTFILGKKLNKIREKKLKEKEKINLYRNVFKVIFPQIQNQIDIFVKMFKATSTTKPSFSDNNLENLFSYHFFNSIEKLDFKFDAPIYYLESDKPHVAWEEYLFIEMKKFNDELVKARDLIISANIGAIELTNIVFDILKGIKNYCSIYSCIKDPQMTDSIAMLFKDKYFFYDKSWVVKYAEHLFLLAKLNNLYNEIKTIHHNFYWKDDQLPKLGSAIRKKEYLKFPPLVKS
jgi:hypothetical protein